MFLQPRQGQKAKVPKELVEILGLCALFFWLIAQQPGCSVKNLLNEFSNRCCIIIIIILALQSDPKGQLLFHQNFVYSANFYTKQVQITEP